MGPYREKLPAKEVEDRTAAAGDQSTAPNAWYRRIPFWRAIAGMALAIALGCAAVAIEIASELSSRTIFFRHRLELLRWRISELRTEADDAQRQLAAVRAEQTSRSDLNRVLSAADAVVLRLTSSPGSKAAGVVVISREVDTAIIDIGGLPAAAGQTYEIWWLLARGAPSKAATFSPPADGRLSLTIGMPPRGASITGAIVTLKFRKAVHRPDDRIMLKGELPIPEVLS